MSTYTHDLPLSPGPSQGTRRPLAGTSVRPEGIRRDREHKVDRCSRGRVGRPPLKSPEVDRPGRGRSDPASLRCDETVVDATGLGHKDTHRPVVRRRPVVG